MPGSEGAEMVSEWAEQRGRFGNAKAGSEATLHTAVDEFGKRGVRDSVKQVGSSPGEASSTLPILNLVASAKEGGHSRQGRRTLKHGLTGSSTQYME